MKVPAKTDPCHRPNNAPNNMLNVHSIAAVIIAPISAYHLDQSQLSLEYS